MKTKEKTGPKANIDHIIQENEQLLKTIKENREKVFQKFNIKSK